MTKYRWATAHEWLGYHVSKIIRDAVILKETDPADAFNVLEHIIHALSRHLDSDAILDNVAFVDWFDGRLYVHFNAPDAVMVGETITVMVKEQQDQDELIERLNQLARW